ncbi:MAG TPA: glycosyltransferase [Candidatus Kapabacteria bacterium]|nr:glycosyltransferase [Candidatus Kapabacteria bacterium]
MATIAFFVDFQIGHIFPTFGLASELVAHNHRVVYFGIPDVEQTVRENGFEFCTIMADFYPLGYMKKISRKDPEQSADSISERMEGHIIPMMRQNILWPSLEQIRPDLIITNFFIIIEATIIYFKTRLPQVIFIPFFTEPPLEEMVFYKLTQLADELLEIYDFSTQQGFKINSLRDLVAPIREFQGIIPCPREFDLPDGLERKNIRYIGPSIRQPKSLQQFNWSAIPSDSKIILASLGSQVHSSVYDIKKIRSFFCKMIEMMNSPLAKGWHLILSLGFADNLGEIGPFPASITPLRWVPQIEVLQRASLAITHGGLGTIKECIFYGVPMIVCPLANDQSMNSKRVTHHNLGQALDIDSTSVENILETIDNIMNNQAIQLAVKNMQQVFRHYEDSHLGVKIIESILENAKKKSP